MSDGLDIHSLLQTGYFATGRAKNGRQTSPGSREAVPPSQPLPVQNDKHVTNLAMRPVSSQVRPPPPSVEDEEVSLAREYGSPVPPKPIDEGVTARGEAEQFPVLLEVHEHNPERRFVIVENGCPDSGGDENQSHTRPSKDSKSDTSRPTTPSSDAPSKVSSRTVPSAVAGEATIGRSESRRRKSGQELPPLETDWGDKRRSEHHRTMSAASAQPPEYFSPRQSSRFQQGTLLSPDIIQHGSTPRDRTHGQPQNVIVTPQGRRGHSTVAEDRRRVVGAQRRSPSPAAGKRSSSNVESTKPRRRMSNDPSRDSRYRESHTSTSTSKERPREGSSAADPRTSQSSIHKTRDEARTAGETSSTAHGSAQRRPKSIVIQEVLPEPARKQTSSSDAGVKEAGATKTNSMPLPSPKKNGFSAGDQSSNLRSSSTFPTYAEDRKSSRQRAETPTVASVSEEGRSTRPKTPTKPVEFVDMPRPRVAPSGPRPNPSAAPAARTERPVTVTPGSSGAKTAAAATAPSLSQPSQESPRTWQPPPFDPEKDGLRPERPVGTFRRFSEGNDASGPPDFPDCPRTKPVAGKMDWLTLPRTDFNICPTCYRSVFSESQYRTEFQPILRPTDKLIACDFGSSPWYRIAWLMTWHKKASDLRLFHRIAEIAASAKAQGCPGNKKSTRTWYTVWNPYDRRPIEDFPVCYQCYKTVETLLPSLSGVFGPLDSRSEPSWRTCELHFHPARQRFVMYYDILERAAEKAASKNQKPNVGELANDIEKLSSTSECREDSPISDGHWHVMQYLPQFTVCGDCFDDVVRPKLEDRNAVACNFLTAQKKLPVATCQLYSPRMREIFAKSCRRNDPQYLEGKVVERQQIEADIHAKLVKLDRKGSDTRVEDQVSQLIHEWKRWE